MTKEFQKHEYCCKNHTRVTSKSNSFLLNKTMEDFTPDLDSVKDLIEEGLILENCCASIDYFVQTHE